MILSHYSASLGIDVGQSLVSVAIKLKPKLVAGIWIVVSLVVAFIIVMSWLGTKNRWFWMAEIAFLVILGIFATYAFLNNSILFIQPLPK